MGFMNDGNPMPVFVHFRLSQKWFNPMNAWFIFGLILTCFMKPILSASLSLSFCQQYLPLFLILYLYLFGSFSISLFLSLTLYPLLYTPLSLPFFLSDSLFLSLFGSFSLCHLSLSFCLLLCIPCLLSCFFSFSLPFPFFLFPFSHSLSFSHEILAPKSVIAHSIFHDAQVKTNSSARVNSSQVFKLAPFTAYTSHRQAVCSYPPTYLSTYTPSHVWIEQTILFRPPGHTRFDLSFFLQSYLLHVFV